MKKILFISLVVLLILTGFAGCGGESEEESPKVSLPMVSEERAVMEQVGAMAIRQYIIARLKTDTLIEYDHKKGSLKELKTMTDDALEAWRLCKLVSVKTVELADLALGLGSSASTKSAAMAYTKHGISVFELFATEVYAAEENAAMKWAKDLTSKYDAYPSGKKIKQLSENLGTDAKNAFAQLKMAQAILEGAAYNDEADMIQKYENAAMATKTACKTGLYIGGVIAGGGVANGILEAGGLVIGGVDTIVDIAATGSTIILGEDNKVTMAANDLKDIIGPVSSVAGGVNVIGGGALKFTGKLSEKMGTIDKLSYMGDSVLDFVSDGKILGGLITVDGDGETNVTMKEISTEGKTPDEVSKELKDAGLPVPEDGDPKTAAELVEEMEEEYTFTEEELNQIIENLRNLLYEMFLDSDEEPSVIPPATTEGLSIDDIVGNYEIVITDEDGETDETPATFTKNKKGQLVEDGTVYNYNQSTGTATHSVESENASATSTFVFNSKNGTVHVSGTFVIKGKNGTIKIYYDGYKVD